MNKVTIYKVFNYTSSNLQIVPKIYSNSCTLVSYDEYKLLLEEHEKLLDDFTEISSKFNKLKEKKSLFEFIKNKIKKPLTIR